MPGLTTANVDNMFTYHAPKGDQVQRYQAIRDAGRNMAHVILNNSPSCPEQTLAIREVQRACMTANAAIACHE